MKLKHKNAPAMGCTVSGEPLDLSLQKPEVPDLPLINPILVA